MHEVTRDGWEGRDEEENKVETKMTKNANHGACQVWEVPSMCSSGREVIEYIWWSQEAMRTQGECCGEG
jgi:hypothetical protein